MSRGELAVWAWSEGVVNFGDELGPHLLARLGYQVRRVPEIHQADLIGCGSVLEGAARNARRGAIIWGSGLMHGEPVDTRRLDIRAVRGQLTASVLGVSVPTGDPASLVPMLYERPRVKHGLGVVRHYVDQHPYPWADIVIDTTDPIDDVIAGIGSCARVASSSLHGLIVAEAWGIPAIRLHHAEVAGGNFKWLDWFSADHDMKALLERLP